MGCTGSIFFQPLGTSFFFFYVLYDVVVPEDEMWGAILEDGSYTGMLKTVHEKSSQTESYIKLRNMITQNHGGRDILKLYNADDISLIMQEKAVLLLDKFSPKLHLSHMCPTLEGRFYIGKGYLYLWNCVWVTHKDFPKDVMVEINRSHVQGGHSSPVFQKKKKVDMSTNKAM
ncbi:hypothetical protein HPB47_006006 [Ixodes persulcatus]|uniref:Uncharacterized protein n=1 Tax=Ixodes persulcatus TaxID=34615 RepID=A0AC60PBW4_IXOPE|nr:hypothetical protein HPB47_006006 [Ixodes persulcatus]